MKKSSAIFLQAVIVLIGIGAFAFLLVEPHLEGRNVNATLFEIYFKDPFLAYVYIGSIPFFMALSQAFKVLGYVRQDKIFSPATVKALWTIQRCAIATIGFVAGGIIFIRFFSGSDDAAGGIAMGILFSFASLIIAATASMLGQIVQNTVER